MPGEGENMGVVIRNLSSRPLYVTLQNGQSVRLAPGGSSPSVHEVQVNGNATIDKLVKRRIVAIDAKAEKAESTGTPKVGSAGAADDSEARTRARKTQ
jgi:hypothetical protein